MNNGLEYIKENHIYKYNGKIIPSVSEILKFIFPNKYDNIPLYILKNKSQFGINLHNIAEYIDKHQITDYEALNSLKTVFEFGFVEEFSLKQYIELKKNEEIEIEEQEQMVCYQGLYGGRYDKSGKVKGKKSLIDLKTTAELDKEYLSWQLSYYELASGKKYQKLYAIWLPKKGKAELVEIERKTKKQLLDKYYEYIMS